MKRRRANEEKKSEEERNDFKKAIKGCRVIPIWLSFSLSPTITAVIQTKSRFQEGSKSTTSFRV